MKFSTIAMLLGSAAADVTMSQESHVAQVHEHIMDPLCKSRYISKHAPACVKDGKCYPAGSSHEMDCREIHQWQWWHNDEPDLRFAPGVQPPAGRRITHNGHAKRKVVWAYTGDIEQGLAYQVYGDKNQVTVESLLNTPVNQVSFIANVQVDKPNHWFNPGKNDTDGCRQKQTWALPFGFSGHDGDAKKAIADFQANLTQIHSAGITITMVMGSWCTSFPMKEWGQTEFDGFVSYFKTLRTETFGGNLDGIDFDWEGYCHKECLMEVCTCDWNDKVCGTKSPDELAAGVSWSVPTQYPGDKPTTFFCWIMPVPATLQVMTGLAHYMKKEGFVVTLVPMSTQVYMGDDDTSPKQTMRNEYVKWRKHTFDGEEVDILKKVDGILLQWYSGFDASLCANPSIKDPHACTCDNVQLKGYENIHNNTASYPQSGLLYDYYLVDRVGGNMYPETWPTRCQQCGDNVILPNGKRGKWPCHSPGEDWFEPGDYMKHYDLITKHKAGWQNYTQATGKDGKLGIGYWWVKSMAAPSRCPRAVDCPDWRYKGEEPYARQVKLLKSIAKVTALDKVSVGFETLGTDVLSQMQSWADPALPWSTASVKDHEKKIWFNPCTTNMTVDNVNGGKRCGNPVLQQQWGLKFNASEVVGLFKAVKAQTGQDLSGIGVFTLDGMMWQPEGKKERIWYKPLCELNKDFGLPCKGPCCQGEFEPLEQPEEFIQ